MLSHMNIIFSKMLFKNLKLIRKIEKEKVTVP